MALGKWGREIERNLREHQPAMYAELKASGRIQAHLREQDELGQAMMDDLLLQLMKDAPDGSQAREQFAFNAMLQARELVREALLQPAMEPPAPEDEALP